MSSIDQQLDESVTAWVERLRRGDREAGDLLHERYHDFLISIARKHHANALSAAAGDEEDLVQSVFHALWKSASQGKLKPVANRESFSWLLLSIAWNKAIQRVRAAEALKRGLGKVVQVSQLIDPSDVRAVYAVAKDDMMSGPFVAEFIDEQERLFALLNDDTERSVASYRLQGFSELEIAAKLGVAVRTVERKVKNIRAAWLKYQGSAT